MTKTVRIILTLSLLANLAIVYVAYKALEYRAHINEFLDKYTWVVEEFGRRTVYADTNQSLASDTTVPNRIVFLGTQVTRNWDLAKSFPTREVINRGVDQQRVAGFLLRFQPDVIRLGPEAVVIEVSSYNFRPNSSIAEVCDYVASLADMATARGVVPVLCTVIPPTSDFTVFEHETYRVADSVAVYNHWLRERAAIDGWPLADIGALVADSTGYLNPELASTHVDLNNRGYSMVTDEVARVLDENLKEK
ncbi:MAG: hypothetical protein KKA42_17085 [candidate division Zixibacteria bacterium]|nr:hypothetical protein [candidate division Zixibacteria bacterium]